MEAFRKEKLKPKEEIKIKLDLYMDVRTVLAVKMAAKVKGMSMSKYLQDFLEKRYKNKINQ